MKWQLKALLNLLFLAATACAQSAPESPAGTSHWPNGSSVSVGQKVKIVRVAAPKRMRSCTVSSLDEAQIACSRRLGLKPMSYKRDDVAAILTPGRDSPNKRYFRICGAVTGSMIAGAVVWGVRGGSVGSVVGSVLVGVVGFSVFGACAMGDNEDDAIPPTLIYRRPGQALDPHILPIGTVVVLVKQESP